MLAHDDVQPDHWLEAVLDQPPEFSEEALYASCERHLPGIDPLWVRGRITADTVNDPGRRHLPHPRDLLFRRPDGLLERYVPSKHGSWSAAGTPVLVSMSGSAIERLREEEQAERAWFTRRAG